MWGAGKRGDIREEGVKVGAHSTLHKFSSRGNSQSSQAVSPSGPSSVSGGVHSLRSCPGVGQRWRVAPETPLALSAASPPNGSAPQRQASGASSSHRLSGPKLGLVFPAGKGAGATSRDPRVGELCTFPSRKGPQDTSGSASSLNHDFEEGL